MEKVSDVLKEFSTQGWPSDWETIEGMTKWMKSKYGLPSITNEIYPDFGPAKVVDGKVAYLSPITKKYETSMEFFPRLGMRWRLEFPNGQMMSVVITDDKRVVERTYTDRGDIPISEVYQFLKSWQTSFKQAQKGKRPRGINPNTIERHIGIAIEWEDWLKVHRNGSVEEFARNHGMSPKLVYTAIKRKKKIVSENRL
jgi:hypothetical protein